MRFHSLPESKRYAENDAERREILRRHRQVLQELRGATPPHDLLLIAEDWDWRDVGSGWTRRYLPHAWPWRVEPPTDPEGVSSFLWVRSGLRDGELDALLEAAAGDEAEFVIADPEVAWVYCPYDGGADVLVGSSAERDRLRDRHAGWLSSHPAGL